MAMQDDIFDVEDALKGKPEAASFDRIYTRFCRMEEENINLNRVFAALKEGARAVKYLLTEGESDEDN
jgi:hypothetical protein